MTLPTRLLVANRGEIALRIARTCVALGVEPVLIAAADDAQALHARAGHPLEQVASYLDAHAIVAAARRARAGAVHPGYGFLAESPALAEAVTEAGLLWIGPPAAALRLGGDKLEAKRVAAEAGVPTLPSGSAAEVGLPLLVKAAAGGGGRGMRVVTSADALDEALLAAAREAEAGFGDGTVFCERWLPRPRHVEVQLLADAHGTVWALGERDCSIQRRHQKVLEEAPAPGLADAVRTALARHAVAFARAIDYRGAGTAEFLVEGEDVFFLELNGRIQVEHPVTEAVTGIDLVELQLRIAAGEPLEPEPPLLTGHAVEARLYAEDPRTFLPQPGRVERLRLPAGIRVDAGVAQGDVVGTTYDPLLAKLVAHGSDREAALDALATALTQTEVGGVGTNLPLLRWLVAHPVVRAGSATTAFLSEHPPLSAPPRPLPGVAFGGGWRLNLEPAHRTAPPALDSDGHQHGGDASDGALTAPMPGTVVAVHVAVGERVEERQPLVVVEAMKMEHALHAPFPGVVSAVHVGPGAVVAAGAILVELGAEEVVEG
jgi:propionyl-CoA carboxylase alpha chain